MVRTKRHLLLLVVSLVLVTVVMLLLVRQHLHRGSAAVSKPEQKPRTEATRSLSTTGHPQHHAIENDAPLQESVLEIQIGIDPAIRFESGYLVVIYPNGDVVENRLLGWGYDLKSITAEQMMSQATPVTASVEVPGIKASEVSLLAVPMGGSDFEPTLVRARVDRGRAIATFNIRKGLALKGVVEQHGSPVSNAFVEIQIPLGKMITENDPNAYGNGTYIREAGAFGTGSTGFLRWWLDKDNGVLHFESKTDKNGRFAFSGMPNAPLKLRVLSPTEFEQQVLPGVESRIILPN